jgi:TDG/mug DNA glycosylase family protein
MQTLSDYLDTGLRAISIGLNPSIASVAAGYYFANPRNRFWRALNASGLVDEHLSPGVAAMQRLLQHYRIGFTDVVKRPTRNGGELRVADYRRWAPLLRDTLLEYRPAFAWFHGKVAYRNFIRYVAPVAPVTAWGLQALALGDTRIYVTPNPSPANAAYSLDDLTGRYRKLARLLREAG